MWKGIGLLYARGGTELVSLIEGGAQERGRRAGTENLPAIAGMAAAFSEACINRQENTIKTAKLRDYVISRLSEILGAVLNGPDPVRRLPGNVSFCIKGVNSESLLLQFSQHGICASAGSACMYGSIEPSHVMLAIGRSWELASGSLILTFSAENTMKEAELICSVMPGIISKLRGE